ncbi:phosphoribosylaminoimidazolesuccinocarboxamide synthase [Candidatus Roizmanbacteria bacterium RIFCSPLOWO2_12_FULL_37_7b]|nr:MAG: phosphoribosylaminoimidazolesuccinocarboxamide synthase [Candidatus Roizmanbacteria bacterium RIFCSPLOWO2_12_FULL_37_7b]
MDTKGKIKNAIPHTLKTVDIKDLGKKIQGKVRDIYLRDDQRILITTDRQSAFDVILGHIPYKVAVLNLLSQFWFEKTRDIVDNHMISVPDPNVMITKNCQPIPVEMVVRGFMTGVTKTSIWYSYEKGERNIYGIEFPEGMIKNQILSKPIITPTTHAQVGQHDERLTREDIVNGGLVQKELYEQMEKASLNLFDFGTKWCRDHGLILVDTKYEFGLYDGKLTLIDEIHTPDSSRFWVEDTYKERMKKGQEPDNFDKEFLRLWYAKRGYTGEGQPPKMATDLIIKLAQRYIDVYEKISNKKFDLFDYPIDKRIQNSLRLYFQ